jgi:hypothetical protein
MMDSLDSESSPALSGQMIFSLDRLVWVVSSFSRASITLSLAGAEVV